VLDQHARELAAAERTAAVQLQLEAERRREQLDRGAEHRATGEAVALRLRLQGCSDAEAGLRRDWRIVMVRLA
jgi:hypothetical protein